jgi:hypothetical protein
MLKRIHSFQDLQPFLEEVKDLPQTETSFKRKFVYAIYNSHEERQGFYIFTPTKEAPGSYTLDLYIFPKHRGHISYRTHATSILAAFFLTLHVPALFAYTLNEAAQRLLGFFGFKAMGDNWFTLINPAGGFYGK